jgi:hypothetical protein
MNNSPEGCIGLQVADGSEVETIGQVYVSSLSLNLRMEQSVSSGASTEFNFEDVGCVDGSEDSNSGDEPVPTGEIFYVVEGLACDLILGEPFLNRTDAFNTGVQISIDRQLRLEKPKTPSIMIFGLIGPVQALFCRKKKRKKQERKKQDEMTWRRESITISFVLRDIGG